MASRHRLIGNFPTVHLRLKSVIELVDFAPRTFRRPRFAHRPRIHVEKGAIWGPNFPNSQLDGKYQRGGPPCFQTRWATGGYIFWMGESPSTSGKRPAVNLRLKSFTEMVALGPELAGDPHMTLRPRIHVEKGEIWDTDFPNSELSGKYSRCGPPCCLTRWRQEENIMSGRVIDSLIHRQLSHSTSATKIGY